MVLASPSPAPRLAQAPVDAATVADQQALIAEAREHARRRRRRVALAVTAAVIVAVAGVLVARPAGRTSHVTSRHEHAAPAVIRTGVVTGYLQACAAVRIAGVVTPGTVTALRGHATWIPAPGGGGRYALPTAFAGQEYISNNAEQPYRFALPPGRYVLVGRYLRTNGVAGVENISITAGKTIHFDFGDPCA
jgi:hypothetical protein